LDLLDIRNDFYLVKIVRLVVVLGNFCCEKFELFPFFFHFV